MGLGEVMQYFVFTDTAEALEARKDVESTVRALRTNNCGTVSTETSRQFLGALFRFAADHWTDYGDIQVGGPIRVATIRPGGGMEWSVIDVY